jgi:lipopolysaccharide transport system permease protein
MRIHSVKDFWNLLFFTVRCRLKSEASTSYLSYGWWVVEPILYMATFYLVFGVFLNQGEGEFVVYLLTGLIPWLWFNKSVSNSTGSILGGQHIMMQTRVPVALFPTAVVAQDSIKQLAVFCLLILFLLAYGNMPTIHWLAIIPLAMVQLAFTACISFLVAAIVPFFPDVRFLVDTGLMMMMFVSGIFYSYDLILPKHQPLFFLNPMATIIKNYRDILLHHQWPDWQALSIIFLICCGFLAIGVIIFRRHRTTYVRLVLES